MQILGKVQLQGKERQILLKQEGELFKYYILELIGAYSPKVEEQKIIFKRDIEISKETKIEIIKLVNEKITNKMIQENKVFQIIGEISENKSKKEILAKSDKDIIKYYFLNLVGVYTPKIPGESIIFKQDTLENNSRADIKDNIQRSKIILEEKEQIEKFLERIKIKEILQEMQKIENRERAVFKNQVKENEIKKNQQKQIKGTKSKEQILKNQRYSPKFENKLGDINIKQEIDMEARVTDMSNLEQVLKKNKKMPKLEHGDEPLKMGIVESDELKNLKNERGQKEYGHSSRFEAVMITKKGKVVSLDLDNDTQEGNNPLEKNYQIKQNNSVKKGDVLTRLKLGKGTIGIEKGKYGEIEVYHSPRKTIGGRGVQGNKSLDRQLETSNSKNTLSGTNIEALKLAQEYNDGYRSVEQGYQEIAEHERGYPNCNEKGIEDLDGEKDTKSHEHKEAEDFVELSSGKKFTYSELAIRWGFYKDGKPDANYIKEKFEKKCKENKDIEEVIKELDEEYEDPRLEER